MFKTLKNAWKVQEIQNKILFTLLIILLYRVGSAIPVPYVMENILDSFNAAYGGTILNYMSILSGGAMSQATLFALSVSPYITSSIVIQLLTVAFPDSLGKLAKEGEEGQKKIKKYTRWVTVAIALVTAYGYTALLANNGWLDTNYITWKGMWASNGFAGTVNTLVIIASYVAGAAIIMWLAELIDAKGIGNGISMILFFNIISRGPALISSLWGMIAYNKNGILVGILLGILSVAITAGMVLLVVWVTHSERRIPIQYAKRVVGRKMYGGQGTHLPIKLNMTGVMPIIFASYIVSVPATIATFFDQESGFYKFVDKWLGPESWIYVIVYIILIVAFAYFYILISFNPIEVANNIKNNGGAVPGIRTGRPTAEYITKILNRITLIGAFFLIIVAGLPMIINIISGGSFAGLAFGGSSLLIVIGVAIETFRDIEAQITMRNYKGFLD
jgi:preprotein translocase subunit SecY